VTRAPITLALILGISTLAFSSLAAQAQHRSVVSVLLTTAPNLSPAAKTALIREASRIWTRAGVRLEWVAPTSRPAGLSLRVLTVEHTGPAAVENTSVLGELVRGAGTGAAAMVAIDRAAAIAARGSLNRGSLSFDQRLGLVLGRAIAHEIGHFLLAGTPHQDEGLMRARFPEDELADAWSAKFEVNPPMKAVAQATLMNGFPARVPAASLPAATVGHSGAID
jgi:hypothetical protein